MVRFLPLSPRYRLDDETHWLIGIDPSRHYWIAINGQDGFLDAIPGLLAFSIDELKRIFRQFITLQAGEQMTLVRAAESSTIHCISQNCYALETYFQGALVWHLFDQETMESLLRTAHPDWQCSPSDLELGRQLLVRSWQQTIAA